MALGGGGFVGLIFKLANRLLDERLEQRKLKNDVVAKELAFEKHMKTDKAIDIMLTSFRDENDIFDRIIITNLVDTGALLTPLSKKVISVSIEAAKDAEHEIKRDFQGFPIRQSYANIILDAKSKSGTTGEDAIFVDVSKILDPSQKAIYEMANIKYEYLVYIKLVTRYDGKELVYCLHAQTSNVLDEKDHLRFKAELSVLANHIRTLI